MENNDVATVLADAQTFVQKMSTREDRLTNAADKLSFALNKNETLQQDFENTVQELLEVSSTLQDSFEGISEAISTLTAISTDLSTRIVVVESKIEEVRSTVVQLLDQPGEPEPTTTTPEPEEQG